MAEMAAAADSETLKTEVRICTRNPVHQFEFRWKIDNATKFSRRLTSHQFPDDSTCKPRFKAVAKFNEKYAGITNVNLGLQRADEGHEVIHVTAEVSLCNAEGDVYRTKNVNFTSCGNESPYYCFSELFTTQKNLMSFQQSFHSSTQSDLTPLKLKGLVGSYKHEDEVFLLPEDNLLVRGVVKCYGCCVVTETLPSKRTIDEYSQISHVSLILQELRTAYEEGRSTDVDLIVEGEAIHAHRFVLSLRSPVFRRMFVEHDTREKSSGRVEIPDMEKQVFEDFVWYLYTGEVREESWAFMCALYATAEKYEVHSFKTACADVMKNLLDESSACGILELADLYHDEGLKMGVLKYLAQNFATVKDNEEWKSIITHNPSLAADVLSAVSAEGRGKIN